MEVPLPVNVIIIVYFKVKYYDFTSYVCNSVYHFTAIECPSLSITNRVIVFASDTTSDFEIGTVATHSCNTGFALVGFMTRTCMDDDQADIVGVWSGSAPTCERNYYLLIVYFKVKCYF